MMRSIFYGTLILGIFLSSGHAITEKDVLGTKPDPVPNLVEYLEKDGNFKILSAAIKATDFEETLKGTNSFTILAPTDDAFRKLPDSYLQLLLAPAGKQKLAGLLGLHIISGSVTVSQLFVNNKVKTFQGQEIPLEIMAGNYMFDQSKLIQANIHCSNGLVDVLDRVLMPFP